MYLVLCETAHGTRYHVFTEVPESYNEDMAWQLGPIEDVNGAVESGYINPDKWDEEGDAEAAFGEAFDEYRRQLEKEYEYQTSDEQVKAAIEANEYTFLADGTLY